MAERSSVSTQSMSAAADAESAWLDLVREHVRSLRYGVVQIVVHGGKVTQIERTERVRLEGRPHDS